jgi:hypothetical protein
MAKKPNGHTHAAKPPEKKIGPYPGGIGVAIWLNQVETDDGPREIRSITIAPRRYKDDESGEWRDSPSFRTSDIPALIHALTQAQSYIYRVPLKRERDGDEGDGEIAF